VGEAGAQFWQGQGSCPDAAQPVLVTPLGALSSRLSLLLGQVQKTRHSCLQSWWACGGSELWVVLCPGLGAAAGACHGWEVEGLTVLRMPRMMVADGALC
jgi:hypothetical protein